MELNWTAGAIGAVAGGVIGFVYKYRQIRRERREAEAFLTDIVSVSPHWTGVMAVYAQAKEDGEDISFDEANRRAKSKWEAMSIYSRASSIPARSSSLGVGTRSLGWTRRK